MGTRTTSADGKVAMKPQRPYKLRPEGCTCLTNKSSKTSASDRVIPEGEGWPTNWMTSCRRRFTGWRSAIVQRRHRWYGICYWGNSRRRRGVDTKLSTILRKLFGDCCCCRVTETRSIRIHFILLSMPRTRCFFFDERTDHQRMALVIGKLLLAAATFIMLMKTSPDEGELFHCLGRSGSGGDFCLWELKSSKGFPFTFMWRWPNGLILLEWWWYFCFILLINRLVKSTSGIAEDLGGSGDWTTDETWENCTGEVAGQGGVILCSGEWYCPLWCNNLSHMK